MKIKLAVAALLALVFVLGIFSSGFSLADDGAPTVAILSYSNTGAVNGRLVQAIFDVLNYHGYLSDDEVASILPNEDFHGENLNVIWRDAGADVSNVNIMTEYALDRGATILVPTTTIVTLNAIQAANESGIEPTPLVIFSLVGAPYRSGVADAPCLKPPNVVGSHALSDYGEALSLLPMLDPDVDYIGSFLNPGNAGHVNAYEQIKLHAEPLGIAVEAAPWVNAGDGIVNADTLIDDGVDMFVSLGYPSSLPAIIEAANAASVPIVATAMSYLQRGVHIAAGFYSYYAEGAVVGQMVTAALDGDLDAGRVGIHAAPKVTVGLNLDTIADAGIDVSDELLERADFVIENGESSEEFVKPEWPDVDMDARRANRAAFLDALFCTDEMIEEQRAELAAAE